MRQLTHDVRNQLNGLELEAALIADSLSDPEAMESLARIREQLHHVAANLRTISARFADPMPTRAPIAAADLFLIFQEQAAAMTDLPPIDWAHTLNGQQINVDATEMADVAKELLANAREFCGGGRLEIRGRFDGGMVLYEFCEPKTAAIKTELWGHSPFCSTKREHYGLGLWEARRLVEANNGKITHEFKPGAKQHLLTTLSFPVV